MLKNNYRPTYWGKGAIFHIVITSYVIFMKEGILLIGVCR